MSDSNQVTPSEVEIVDESEIKFVTLDGYVCLPADKSKKAFIMQSLINTVRIPLSAAINSCQDESKLRQVIAIYYDYFDHDLDMPYKRHFDEVKELASELVLEAGNRDFCASLKNIMVDQLPNYYSHGCLEAMMMVLMK